MSFEGQPDAPEVDEASWIYLSIGAVGESAADFVVEELKEACASSGWTAVSHPPLGQGSKVADPGQYFASVSHAVEHADAVVAMIGGKDDMADAELTLAFSHGRPVVGVQIGEASLDTKARMLLSDYERARIVTCTTPSECAVSLRETLSDPAFVETIRQSA